MKHYYTIVLLLMNSPMLMAQSTVESIPNQKLINGSYVSNPDGILDMASVRQIDSLLASLEKQTTVQVAVVVVKSIGNEDNVDFSQRLFTRWGIGDKSNNNGLLLLLVEDVHTVRFHTGYGVEGVLPDVICKRIQVNLMLPEFRNGHYGAGVLAGLNEVNKILTNPEYAEELKKEETSSTSGWSGFMAFLVLFCLPPAVIVFWIKAAGGKFADSKESKYTPYPEMRQTRSRWLIEYVGIPLLIILTFGFGPSDNAVFLCFMSLYLYYMLTLFIRLGRMKKVTQRFLKEQQYHEIVEFIRKDSVYWFFMGLLFPFPFFLYFFYHLYRKKSYRNHPRKCSRCDGAMRKLSEKEEDEFLSKEQQMEETVKSVDYDVWQCKSCQAIDCWFFLNRHSKYTACPKCKTLAYYSVSRRTIDSPSYTSSGTGEEIHACKFCGYTKKSTYTIAQLVASTSSSSSSSFGGGSSSSGGSWGGGSSGGGGASSSW